MVLRLTVLPFILGYIGGVFLFSFFNRKKEAFEQNLEQKKNVENVDVSMLCKFVRDGTGKKLGESISINNDILIIKSGSRFMGVPLKHVEPTEKTLIVKGLIDFTKAFELGEKWRKKSYREMNLHDQSAEKSKR